MACLDLDMVKEIPGYKVILKAVLKSQIQQLVGYLANLTEEESVLLTANVSDGSLSQLGSDSGKVFLQDRKDLKAEFLEFCLKRHMENIKRQNQQVSKLEPQNSSRNSLTQQTKITAGAVKAVRHKPYPSSKPKSSWENTKIQTNIPSIEIDIDDAHQNENQDEYSHNTVDVKEEFDMNNHSYINTDSGSLDISKFENATDTSIEEEGVSYQTDTHSEEASLAYDTSWQPGPSSRVSQTAPSFYLPNEEKQTFGFPCDQCGKIFGAKSDLTRHHMVHTGEKPYPCPICSKKFRQKVHRRSHMMRHHLKEVAANANAQL